MPFGFPMCFVLQEFFFLISVIQSDYEHHFVIVACIGIPFCEIFLVLCSVILFQFDGLFFHSSASSRFIVDVYVYSLFIMLFVCIGSLIVFNVVPYLLLTDYFVCPSILNYVVSVYWFTDCCVCHSICLSY